MNRSNMKSNLSFQPEGRLIPRRKVATKSHLLNGVGDFDMELSLAIQESLKYAQQKEQERVGTPDTCRDDVQKNQGSEELNGTSVMKGRADQMRTNCHVNRPTKNSVKAAGSEEVGRLKDLLLSQLELIQCQQEELKKKDKEIKSLQSAKDTLQCRLERMERRLSIMKQREESHERSRTVQHASKSTPLPPALNRSITEVSKIEFKKKRRRGQSSQFSQKKRHRSSFCGRPSGAIVQANGLKEVSDSDNEENDDTSEDSDSGDREEAESGSESDDSGKHGEANEMEHRNESPSVQNAKEIDYPIMQTDILYHLYYPKHACPASPDAKRLQEQIQVETPSWRLKPLTNMYQLEGTENITDEAYYKRHLKFEQEEKRRKRWDLQRIRELRMFEKLERQKEEELRASQDEADMETFLPSILDLKQIEITESVPVMAFGQPIPYICPAEFEIPWEMSSSAPSASTSRHKVSSSFTKKH
ncbi:male-specific lethal 1 [Plakobranchus ocellatus]|uniref:Male-specific lethal 1 n=1 Tax=Plakobranchus ocellatus TaxID=259542 RepID=A0AAV3XSP3_9GAST|nr:male-specific lethal 1 [Plakobranchus ocellatus]